MSVLRKCIFGILVVSVCAVVLLVFLAQKKVPEKIQYGMSFSVMYAEELGLNWKETYNALLDELGVRHLRLVAYWPMIEPINNVYNFKELDYQIQKAEEVNADVVLAVGRRLPRWPECHIPSWVKEKTEVEKQEELLEYISVVVNRYKESDVIVYWQIENEPYLEVFAKEHCGEFDKNFFEKEVAYFRSLDNSRPFLITDSGNLGTWAGPYKHGDAFGTSVYVHFWNPELGQFRTILPPWFYRVKENVLKYIYGEKETMLIELSLEPWLLQPIAEVPIKIQYSRMDSAKFNDIIEYAKNTRYQKQYLWGGEWWYWLKLQGNTEMWEKGRELFK